MRKNIIWLCLVMAALLLGSQTEARKLPAGAYIKSAKIEVLSGEPERYDYAIIMLDSLFLHYGPHAEGLNWMVKIMTDMVDKSANLDEKADFVVKLVAYADSLNQCCGNEDVKKKYRKNCKKLTTEADDALTKFWREMYNAGVEQKDEITRLAKEISDGVDDETKTYYDEQIAAMSDSSLKNMSMAIKLNPADERPYIGLGSVYQDQNNLEESIKWLELGLEKSADRKPLLPAIAYNHIAMDDYCAAIPYFREYVDDFETQDVATMYNLSICYNNCQQHDSAVTIYHRILEISPDNANAFRGLADYHFTTGRDAADSSRQFDADTQTADRDKWNKLRDERFDSARVYQKQVFDLQDESLQAAERYGMMCYLVSDFEEAIVAYVRSTEIDPDISDNWATLGDCYISTRKFEEAAAAYEMVVELEPDKTDIWQRLSELYVMTKQPDKKASADKKIKELE